MPNRDVAEANKVVVKRFYEGLCNEWRIDLVDEILSDQVLFRASLGSTVTGREAFKRYLEKVRAAFPDLRHRIDEILAVDDRVVTRLTYSGTHKGRLGDVEPTGAHVEFVGAGFFRLSSGLIEEAWVVGDTQEVWRALGRL